MKLPPDVESAEEILGPAVTEVVFKQKGRPVKRSPTFWKRIREKVLLNEHEPLKTKASSRQLAAELGVDLRFVLEERRRLINKGVIIAVPGMGRKPASHLTPSSSQGAPTSMTPKEAESLLAAIEGGKIVDREQRMLVLSRIIAYGHDMGKMRAIEILDNLERGTEGKAGYKQPADSKEAESILKRILRAAGRPLVQKTISRLETEGWSEAGTESDPEPEGDGSPDSPPDVG